MGGDCCEVGRVGGKVVVWVQQSARLRSVDQGGQVSGGRMPSGRAEAQSADGGCQGGLSPRLGTQRASAHVLKASPDIGIEGIQGSAMVAWRGDPGGVGNPTEGRAVPQKEQSSLNIRERCQLCENRPSLLHTLLGGERLTERLHAGQQGRQEWRRRQRS